MIPTAICLMWQNNEYVILQTLHVVRSQTQDELIHSNGFIHVSVELRLKNVIIFINTW